MPLENETVTLRGVRVPMPRTWEDWHAWEARVGVELEDHETWLELLHATVETKNASRV